MCEHVADKYIEYELVLVLMDIVLHQRCAFRHLYRNRKGFLRNKHAFKWLLLTILCVSAILKVLILNKTAYERMNSYLSIQHLVLTTIAEHALASLGMFIGIGIVYKVTQLSSGGLMETLKRLYIAAAFPETIKVVAIVMQLFDVEPTLLLLMGMLMLSIQVISLQSVFNIAYAPLLLSVTLATAFRVLVRVFTYSGIDIWTMGVFL
jgi:hypothetical protein